MFRALILALLITIAAPVNAVDLTVDLGKGWMQPDSARIGLSFPVKSWLNLETGVLGTNDGTIVDVTPMLHYGKRWYVEGGIGLSLATARDLGELDQSSYLNFRDVLGVGYHFPNGKWTAGVRYVHYSNGGRLNPIFGTDDNHGYDWFVLHVRYKF